MGSNNVSNAPYASFWTHQPEFESILATIGKIVSASLLAFLFSQILDIFIYQKTKSKINREGLDEAVRVPIN
jgi:uncharacterized PurR-regulated membrane protein YhhQ (DUF165 family)